MNGRFIAECLLPVPYFTTVRRLMSPSRAGAQSLLHIDSTRAFDGSGANDVRGGTSTSEDGRK